MCLSLLRGRTVSLLIACLPVCTMGDALVLTRAMDAPTIAEIYIEKEFIRTELEIGWADVSGFRNLLPSPVYQSLDYGKEPLEERLKIFFEQDFVFRGDGELLPAALRRLEIRKRVQRDAITGEAIASEEAEDVLYAEIIHDLNSRPQELSFSPPLNEGGYPLATIGLQVYHHGLPVNDFRYLGRREVLTLDWEDPWYSQFENKNLRRQYNEPINVFMYIEPFETRVEVVIRPKDIQHWVGLGLEDVETIPVDLQQELIKKIAAFISTEMQLEIDGQRVEPEFDRAGFLKRTLRSSTVIDPPEKLDAVSATLGIIYRVPTGSLPQAAELTWNLFSPKMQTVRAASTDEAGPLPYFLKPDDNVLVWKNFLTNPTVPGIKELETPDLKRWISLSSGLPIVLIVLIPTGIILYRRKGRLAALVGMVLLYTAAVFVLPLLPRFVVPLPGKAPLSEQDQLGLVQGLLGNVYASFDFHDESAVYDALEQSLSGDLLSGVYLETMRTLELKSQGGARVKVKEVTLNEAAFNEAGDGFRATCNWDVRGSVGHWGHVHERVNRYAAELLIEPVDGPWKITRLELLEEQRVK